MAYDLSDYVDVATRIKLLIERYPAASISCSPPELVHVGDRTFIAVTAHVDCNDGSGRTARASAWEPFPGRTPYTKDSEAMVGETSAVGRAIGLLGIGLKASVATSNEIQARRPGASQRPQNGPHSASNHPSAPQEPTGPQIVNLDERRGHDLKPTEKQIDTVKRMMAERNIPDHTDWSTKSRLEVSNMIETLKNTPRA